MSKFRTFFFALLGLILMSGLLAAQAPTGKIIGTVTDDEGTPLPGITVEATSPKMIGTSGVMTNENGVYRIFALPPGKYTITYTLEGFNTIIRKGIIIRIEQTIRVDITMTPGTIEEEITVLGRSPLIDVKSTVKGMTLSQEMFEMLPRGRSFETLVTAVAGVNDEPYLSGISIDGASGAENMYYIDGMDISEMYSGEIAQWAVFEFVDEIQIVASGYQAEFGGSMGGVINVITRSGGNVYHGELIGYLTPSFLRTKDRDTLRLELYDPTKAEYVNYQDLYGKDKVNDYEVGFSLGGYVLKDRLWFFGTFLPRFKKSTRDIVWELPGNPTGTYDRMQKYWNAQAKITAQPIGDLRVSASFVYGTYIDRGDLPARGGDVGGPDTKEWANIGWDYPNWSANVSADYTVGNNFLISARGGMFRKNQTNQQVPPPSDPRWRFMEGPPGGYSATTNTMFPGIDPALVHPTGWSNIGYDDLFATNKQLRDRQTANLDFTYYLNLGGEHAWKAGVQWVRIEEDVDNTITQLYVLLAWDRTFVHPATKEETKGTYGFYGIRGGISGPFGTFANPSSIRWAIYLQDSWTPEFLDGKFTLNVGIRAEKEDIPSFSDLPEYQYPPIEFGFGDKVAPRVGFTYDVFGDASLKFFGSYGLYYDVMKLEMAQGSYGGFKWITDYYELNDPDFTKIVKGSEDGAGPYFDSLNWRIPSFDTTDTDLKAMSQQEISFGVEKKISEFVAASARVVYKHLRYTIEDVGVQTMAGEQYFTSNPGFGWTLPIAQGGKFDDKFPTTPKAKREYWAVNLDLDKRFSDNWMAGASYTWSSLSGNYSGLASSDEWGRNSPNVERYWDLWWHHFDKNLDPIDGKLNTDRPHQFKLWGSYVFDWGLTVGLVANGMSGIPVSRELDVGLVGWYGDGRLTDGRTPFLFFANIYAEYNLKVTDRYKIQLNLNVDNILDTKTARRIFNMMSRDEISLTDDERLAGFTFDHDAATVTTNTQTYTYTKEPRFLKEMTFYSPLQARIGLKFIF